MPTGYKVIKQKFPCASTIREKELFNCFQKSTMVNGRKYNGRYTQGLFPLQERHCQSVITEAGCGLAVLLNIIPGSHHKSELADKMKSM